MVRTGPGTVELGSVNLKIWKPRQRGHMAIISVFSGQCGRLASLTLFYLSVFWVQVQVTVGCDSLTQTVNICCINSQYHE